MPMRMEVLPDADAVAHRAAQLIADAAREAVAARGLFAFAVSGGRTPWQMLSVLGGLPLPWGETHLFQVDERVAPNGDPDRNLTHIAQSLLAYAPMPPGNVHAMPVNVPNLAEGAVRYASELLGGHRFAADP